MPNPIVKIFIGTVGDDAGAKQVEAALRKADAAADGFINTLKLGAGIDIGGRIVGSLASVPSIFEQAIRRGVAFNTSLADSQVAIANVVKQFRGLNDEAAKQEAARAIAKIIEVEPQAAGSLQDLTAGLLATLASAQAAGIGISQNVELVGAFANALANANIPAEQLAQEMRAIFTGNITPDAALGKLLGITNADVERAKQAGTLYEFLTEKIGALGVAGDTFGVKWSSLQSALDKALGALAEGTTNELAKLAEVLSAELVKPETIAAFRALGVEIAHLVQDGAALLSWAVRNAETLANVARAAGTLAIAFAALKLRDLVLGFGLKTAALFRSTSAIAAETAAVQANTAAQVANAGARAAGAGGGFIGGKAGLIGAGNVALTTAILLPMAIELGQSWGESYTRSWMEGANRGAADSMNRASAMEQRIGLANTDDAKLQTKRALNEAILKTVEQTITAEGALRRNLEAELLTYQELLRNFNKLAGVRAVAAEEAEKKARMLTPIQRELVNLMEQETGILAMRAAGFTGAADEAERELEARKQIAELMKQMPNLGEGEARKLVEERQAASDALKAEAARRALLDAGQTPEQRAQRLSGDFERLTGRTAPGPDATAEQAAEAAGNDARALELARQIGEAWKAVAEERAKVAKEGRDAWLEDVKLAAAYQDAKRDMAEELQIQGALLSGDKARVRELERQREIRAETQRLVDAGYGKAEAAAAAQRLADAKAAVATQERERTKGDAAAGLAVDVAKGTRSKRDDVAAADAQLRRQKQREFEEAGFSPAEAATMAGQAADAADRARRRESGTIGGPARRSSRDTLGGGIDNLAELRRPLADSIAQAAGAGAAAGAAKGGAKPDNGAAALKEAADQAKAAGAEITGAAEVLKGALSDVKTSLATLTEEVKGLLSRETGR